jgi:hypothetical protein
MSPNSENTCASAYFLAPAVTKKGKGLVNQLASSGKQTNLGLIASKEGAKRRFLYIFYYFFFK